MDLTDISGVSLEMCGKYYRGKAILSVNAIKIIADAFDIRLDYLVGEDISKLLLIKKTVSRLQEIQIMDSKSKDNLFNIIDAVICDYKIQKAMLCNHFASILSPM